MEAETRFQITDRSSPRAYPADCEFGLELTRQFTVFNAESSQGAWRLRVVIIDAHEIDPNVFLYQRRTDPSEGVDSQDVFVGVCSPVDLEDYPAGNPDPNDSAGFFRMGDIDVLTRNRDQIDRLWELILEDLQELVETITNICELEDPVTIVIGTIPSSSSSSSSAIPRSVPRSAPRAVEAPPTVSLPLPKAIVVTHSDDALIPAGIRLVNTGGQSEPLSILWEADLVDGKVLLSVHPDTNDFDFSFVGNGFPVDSVASGKISNDCRAIINYERDGVQHVIRVDGEW